VADMHQRKAEMARQSDAFIALPGEPPTQSRATRSLAEPESESHAVLAATDF
jgi:predicted Rossmann-fold nucleotide-binding protein